MATITSPRSSSPAVPTITSPTLASSNNTPASSVRASIDLPPSQQPGTNNPSIAQRRNRAALRDYYNLKAKPSPTQGPSAGTSPAVSTHNLSRTASITSTTSSSAQLSTSTFVGESALPASLDDPSFDAEAYIANLLKTSSLRDVLRTESSLVSEIRNLDGERKALVYDNYSKLIAAVGTIGEMQRGIVAEKSRNGEVSGIEKMKGLEGKLDELMSGFREMSGAEKNQDGNPNRKEKGGSLRNDRDMRRKKEVVRWVLDTPQRLGMMLEDGRREEAENEWKKVEALLEKWDNVAGVDEIRTSCEQLFESDDDSNDND